MPREVRDAGGTAWSCVQVYAGLSTSSEKEDAARVDGTGDRFHVVCTPSGGAQSVRLELAGDWESALPDEELLREIERTQDTR